MSPSRPTQRRLHVLALGAVLLFNSGLAAQEDQSSEPAPSQTWTLNCSGAAGQAKLTCTLSQVLITKDGGMRVLTAVVTKNKGKFVLNLGLPHGLNLPKGVDIWIDDAARQNYPIVTADQKGSYAMITLDDALIRALRIGKLFNVAVTTHAGNEIILQLSLTGFSTGFSRL